MTFVLECISLFGFVAAHEGLRINTGDRININGFSGYLPVIPQT